MAKRVRLSATDAFRPGEARVLPHAGPAPFRSILFIQTEHGPKAFFNVCQHLPVPLDAGSGEPPIVDGDWVCGTHGARYELSTGFCHAGPCRGAALVELRLEVEQGVIYGWVAEDGGPIR